MKLAALFIAPFFLVLSGCGSSESSTQGTSNQPQNTQAVPPSLTPNTDPAAAPNIQSFSVIREIHGSHSALFIIQSDQAGVKITGVTGPQFLGEAQVGTLDQKTMDHLFNAAPAPMSLSEKKQLFDQYQGALIVYFEGYAGSLCSGQSLEVDVNSTFPGWNLISSFSFVAQPTETGDCKFLTLSALTTSASAH